MRDRDLRHLPCARDERGRRGALEGSARRREAQARERRHSDVPDAGALRLRAARAVRARGLDEIPPSASPRHHPRDSQADQGRGAFRTASVGADGRSRPDNSWCIETRGSAGGRAYSMVNFDNRRRARSRWFSSASRAGASAIGCSTSGTATGRVEVFGPLGRAVFRPEEDKNIVCIAGGSGIAGMMSILERAVQRRLLSRLTRARCSSACARWPTHSISSSWRAMSRLRTAISTSRSRYPMKPRRRRSHADFPALKLASGMVHEVAGGAMAGWMRQCDRLCRRAADHGRCRDPLADHGRRADFGHPL